MTRARTLVRLFLLLLLPALAGAPFLVRAQSVDNATELTRTRLAAAEALLQLNRISTARGYLEAIPNAQRELPWHFLARALDRSARAARLPSGAIPIASVLSDDGRLLAVAGADNVVRILSYPSLEVLRELKGHAGSLSTVAFDRAGTRLASGGRDHAVILWDVATGARLASNATAFSQGIYQVRFSPDGARLGVVSWELDRSRPSPVVGFAMLLDARDLSEQRKIETDAHPTAGIVFLPDGRTIVVSSWGEIVYGFETETGAPRWKYDLSDAREYNAFHSIALSPDGATVAVGGTDFRIHLLDTRDGTVKRRLEPWEGHRKIPKALAWSRDGRTLASAGEDQTILVWNTADWSRRAELVGHVATVNGLSWSLDGATLVSTAQDSTLKLWDMSRPFLHTTRICQYGPWQTPVAPDGSFFAAPCSDKKLALHGLAKDSLVANLAPLSGLSAVVSADARRLVTASFDGIVRLWDLGQRREIRTFAGHTARIDGVALLDRRGLVVSAGDTTVRVWDMESGRVARVVRFDSPPFRVVAHPDGGRVFVSAADGSIRVLETDGWREVARYAGTTSAQEIALSPDGALLAVFAGRVVHVWETATGTQRHELRGHEASGYGVGFSPDGRWLVTGGNDLTMRIWDLRTGSVALTYHAFNDAPYTTRFVGMRELLVTSGEGQVWHFRF